MALLASLFRFLVTFLLALFKIAFPSKLQTIKITLKIPDLSAPLKVVHLSDLHFDHPHAHARITEKLLDETIKVANDANADLIVITGDYVQFAPEPCEPLAQKWLIQLKAKYGVYGVLGNHDLKEAHSKDLITQQLTKVNIKVLDNEVCFPMGTDKGALMLVGFCDYTRKQFKLEPVEQQLSDFGRPKLILSHHPDSAELLRKYRADVILAGHTHGGQVLLPYLGTPLPFLKKILPIKLSRYLPVDVLKNWDWLHGLHSIPRSLASDVGESGSSEHEGEEKRGRNYLYINRGLATHPPLRFNCRPEITIIDLIPC